MPVLRTGTAGGGDVAVQLEQGEVVEAQGMAAGRSLQQVGNVQGGTAIRGGDEGDEHGLELGQVALEVADLVAQVALPALVWLNVVIADGVILQTGVASGPSAVTLR